MKVHKFKKQLLFPPLSYVTYHTKFDVAIKNVKKWRKFTNLWSIYGMAHRFLISQRNSASAKAKTVACDFLPDRDELSVKIEDFGVRPDYVKRIISEFPPAV